MIRRAYLFDFDGTLVDTMDGFADIAAKIINEFHPEISFEKARESYLRTSGAPFIEQVEMILPGNPTNPEKVNLFETKKKTGFFQKTFSNDVRNTINTLRYRGYLTAVSSNNYQELIDTFIKREKLHFDLVLGFRSGFKKGKDHFNYITRRFGLTLNELIFIGDSLRDAESAISNGVNFIGLCGTFNKTDFLVIDPNITTINNLQELLDQ